MKYGPDDQRYLALMERSLETARRARIAEATGYPGKHPVTAFATKERREHEEFFIRNRVTIVDEWSWA